MSTTEHRPCKIVGISGSLRSGSYTTMAVGLGLRGAEELKCETKLINLREYHLVFCDGKDDESQYPKDVFRLRDEVKSAQGIILGTPEYHGGYSGVLKNAFAAAAFNRSAPTMMATLNCVSVGLRWTSAIKSRIWSMVMMRSFDSGRTQ